MSDKITIPDTITNHPYFCNRCFKVDKKKEIWEKLKQLYGDARKRNDESACDSIAQIAHNYLPTVASSRDVFSWVAKAASRDPCRKYLNYVVSEDGLLLATDGTRLHLARVDEYYPDGRYHVKTRERINIDVAPFRWRKVVPGENIDGNSIDDYPNCGKTTVTDEIIEIGGVFYNKVSNGLIVSSTFHQEAMSCDSDLTMIISEKNLGNAKSFGPLFYLFNNCRKAFVMPTIQNA